MPKFVGKNYDDFTAQFNEIAARNYGTYGAPIDYLLRKTNGAYSVPWTTRAEKLRNCLSLAGPEFISDCKMLYSLAIYWNNNTRIPRMVSIEY